MELAKLRTQLPPDMHLAFFYDQSSFVREAVGSVWESIIFGLILSIAVLYLFLRSTSTTAIAALVIPITVLITVAAMHMMHMTFNLMTLGGIAAAIGLVIDDAIVVVEDIYSKICIRPRADRSHPCGRPGGHAAAGWFDADADRRVYPAGVSRRRGRRLFPGAGDHHGRRLADVSVSGGNGDADAGGPVPSRARHDSRRMNSTRAALFFADSWLRTNGRCAGHCRMRGCWW